MVDQPKQLHDLNNGVPITSLADTDLLLVEIDQGGVPKLRAIEALTFKTLVSGAVGLGSWNSGNADSQTLTGDLVLTDQDLMIQTLDPGGSNRTVKLPAADLVTNHTFVIINSADAFEFLTVTDADDVVLSVIGIGRSVTFIPSGTSWFSADGKYRQLWIGGWKPTKTNGCAASVELEMATNKNVYDVLGFDKDAVEYARANIPLPDDYLDGTTIFGKPYWAHPSTTTNFKVSWALQGVAIGDDDTMDVAQGTQQISNDTGGTTSDLYKGPLTPAITIAGTPAAGELVNFRCSRVATDGTNDTLAVDAYLLGWMIWYKVG